MTLFEPYAHRWAGAVVVAVVVALSSVAHAQWAPRPAPSTSQLYQWTPVLDGPVTRVVDAGASVELHPERLSVLRVQFEPARLAPYVDLERVFRAGPNGGARVAVKPVRLGDGDWLVVSSMHDPVPVELSLSKEAPLPMRVTVRRLERSPARYYWVWWMGRLAQWLDGHSHKAAPAGLAIPSQQGVLQDVRVAKSLEKLVDKLGASDAEKKAARHLGRLRLLRAVEQRRRPSTTYYERQDLLALNKNPLPRERLHAGARPVDGGGLLGEGQRVSLVVNGPAQVHLGLRAVKSIEQPDATTTYSVALSEHGEVVRKQEFSSRAAKYDPVAPTASQVDASAGEGGGDDGSDQSDEVDEPEDTDDASSPDASSQPAAAAPATASDGRVFARDERGRVVGWHRRTRWWVPPGKHRYELQASGADVVLDASVWRPKELVEDAVTHRWDPTWQLAKVNALLGAKTNVVSRLLRVERAALIDDRRALRTLVKRYEKALAHAHNPAVATWYDWQRLESLSAQDLSVDLGSEDADHKRATDRRVDPVLRRKWAFAMAKVLLDRGQPRRARRLVRLFEPEGDTVAQVLVRARAELDGGADRWERWGAVDRLYHAWLERPTTAPIRHEAQSYWWKHSYWRDLDANPIDADPDHGKVDIQEAVRGETGKVYVNDVRGLRDVWYRVPPGEDYAFRTPSAFDRPHRLARVRVAISGPVSPGWFRLLWNDKPVTALRLEERQELEFAARAGQVHRLRLPKAAPDPPKRAPKNAQPPAHDKRPDVYVNQPPLDTLALPVGDVMRERTYWQVSHGEERTFALDGVGHTRFVRIAVRGQGDAVDDLLRCDFGNGVRRVVPVKWHSVGEPRKDQAVTFVLRVPASARQVTLWPRHQAMLVAVEMRAGRLPNIDDDQRTEVAVKLPVDAQRLEALRELTVKLRGAATLARTKLLIKRAELLMSMAQNRLAKVDLERAMSLVPTTHPLFEQARLLRRAVLDRLSSKFFDVEDSWLADAASMAPLDLAAQAVVGTPSLQRCGLDPDAPASSHRPSHKRLCRRARLVVKLGDLSGDKPVADPAGQLALLRKLLAIWPSKASSWQVHRLIAERLLERLSEGGGDDQKARWATTAYGHARRAAELFPIASVRRVWYAALGSTQWTTLGSLAGGVRSAVANLRPERDVENAANFQLPVIDDPARDDVRFALLGVRWPRSHSLQMFQDSQRVVDFVAPRAGQLELRRICVDLRPDLQPPGKLPACRILGELRREDGAVVAPNGSKGSVGSQRVVSSRWEVDKGQEYSLQIRRTDDVDGRLAYAYATMPDADGNPQPLLEQRQRRLRMLAPSQPGSLVVLGPTYLRVDARLVDPKAHPSVTSHALEIEVTHVSQGANKGAKKRTVELSDAVQKGAFLSSEAHKVPLGRARRAEIWLKHAGAYRLTLRSPGAVSAVRVQARVFDATSELEPPDEADESAANPKQAVASAKDTAAASPAAVNDTAFDPQLALQTVSAPEIAAFGERDLLDERGFHVEPYASASWQADDTTISDESGTSTSKAQLEVLGGAFANFDKYNLWLAGRAGLRMDFDTVPVVTAGTSVDWRPDLWKLRVQPSLDIYSQTHNGPFWAMRGSLRLVRSFGLTPNLWWVHDLTTHVRLQQAAALDAANKPFLSARLASVYASDHPVTTDYLSLLWWRPFLNLVGYAYLQPVLNPNMSLDKLRMRFVGRALFDTTRVDLGYKWTWYVHDGARSAAFIRHDLDLSGRLYYWVVGDQLLDLEAYLQGSYFDYYTADRTRVSFGLRLSHAFGQENSTAALPPTDLTFEELIEPRYFER